MIVPERKYVNNGSNALKQKREKDSDKRYYTYVDEGEIERRKSEKQKKLRKQAGSILSILFVFILGSVVIYRYSTIYNLENNYDTVSQQVDNLNKEKQSLNLALIQYNKIENIQNNAAKLNMVAEDKSTAVASNYDRNTIKEVKNSNNTKTSKSILANIINFIYKK